MAVTSQQIVDFLIANPGMTDAQIVAAMDQYGISPTQMAEAVGIPEGQIAARVAETVPPGSSVTLGDTVIVPQYQTIGSGMDQQIGALESFASSKTNGDVNYKAPVGTPVQIYSSTGELVNTVKTKKDQSFLGGLVDAFKDPVVLAALGGAAYGGLLGGAGTAAGATGAGTAFDLANAGIAGGASGFTAAELAAIEAAQAAGTAGVGGAVGGAAGGAAGVAGMGGGTGLTAGAGGLGLSTGGAGLGAAGTGAGITAGTGLGTGVLSGSALGTGAAGLATGVGAGAGAAGTGLLTSAVKAAAPTVGSLVSSGLTTAGGLLQSQTSKEAAQKAQSMIDAETAAAKKSAAFSPVGMTTRFGTSEFKVDPTTGKLTSAGYTLSPEAKAAQDRFVKLAEQGIQQAEGAQKAFEPLQTGAQSLFTLGNKYLAQTPEQVASDYLKSQMALLQPGRELELANLQNRLQQQGRGGLSVSQGGNLGATTPELQALFNARAQQEALLAANAQQAGQQNVMFGAGLLGTGAQTMGQYYGGQQAAYSPYTTAMGQVTNLETAGQQPFTMGVNLGQIGAQAGANVGQLGLAGAGQSVRLATGEAATNNPLATVMSGLGSSGLLTTGINTAVKAIGNQLDPSVTGGINNLGGEFVMFDSTAPSTARPTGPMDVNTAQLGSALGFKLPSDFVGTTQTLLPMTVGYSF